MEHSDRQRESELTSNQITTAEAIERGIPSSNPPPEPKTCQFCGKTLYHRGIVLWGSIMAWSPLPDRCDCEAAAAYWVEEDKRAAEEKARREAEERQKANQARYEKLLGESGMKKRFLNRTFDTYIAETPEQTRAKRTAKRYADTFEERASKGTGLYIEGTYGTGKTHLAAAIALQLIAEGRSVIFKTSIDLFSSIRSTFDGERSEEELMRAYKTCELLVIDDLGKEQCTEWGVTQLFDILNDRYERMLPTIVTTNYGRDDLIKALTPNGDETKARAIISRFLETAAFITMAWDDHRHSGGSL